MPGDRKPNWISDLGPIRRLALAAGAGLAAFVALSPFTSFNARLIAGWDAGALAWLALAWTLVRRASAEETRAHASTQDASGYVIFLLVVAAACASVVAIGYLTSDIRNLDLAGKAAHLALSTVALVSSWLLIHTVFAYHYARAYYDAMSAHAPGARPPLAFPGDPVPDYLDFAYYAFVVGMTSQVSDVAVHGRALRRITLVHGVLAFIFNMAVLALSINIIASVF